MSASSSFLLHRCAASILYEHLLLHAFMPPSFIYSPLVHPFPPFPPFLNRIFSMRTCVTALPEHSCSAHIYSLLAPSSALTISPHIYCLHVSMLCPPCTYLLFTLGCSGCLAFYFVCPFLPSYQLFFLILLPLLSISFLLAFLLGCSCCQPIDAPL